MLAMHAFVQRLIEGYCVQTLKYNDNKKLMTQVLDLNSYYLPELTVTVQERLRQQTVHVQLSYQLLLLVLLCDKHIWCL